MKIAILGIVCVLAGCATSPVAKLTEDTYTLSVNAGFGGMSRSALENKALGEADDFCAKQGKVAHLINKNDAGFAGITNTSATIAFSCVANVAATASP